MQGEPGRCPGAIPWERVGDGSLRLRLPNGTGASDGPDGSGGKRLIQK